MIKKHAKLNTARTALLAILAATTLASCATGGFTEDIPSAPRELPPVPKPAQIPGALPGQNNGQAPAVGTVAPVPAGESIAGQSVAGAPINRNSIRDPGHPLARRIIFFGYDSSEIGPESISLLEQHAQYLSLFRDVRVRLEGHTDERGSREYNIALGDNRARSVARILQLQGVDAGQFSTLSYGEEVPLDESSGESAWRRNRRVELVYEGLN